MKSDKIDIARLNQYIDITRDYKASELISEDIVEVDGKEVLNLRNCSLVKIKYTSFTDLPEMLLPEKGKMIYHGVFDYPNDLKLKKLYNADFVSTELKNMNRFIAAKNSELRFIGNYYNPELYDLTQARSVTFKNCNIKSTKEIKPPRQGTLEFANVNNINIELDLRTGEEILIKDSDINQAPNLYPIGGKITLIETRNHSRIIDLSDVEEASFLDCDFDGSDLIKAPIKGIIRITSPRNLSGTLDFSKSKYAKLTHYEGERLDMVISPSHGGMTFQKNKIMARVIDLTKSYKAGFFDCNFKGVKEILVPLDNPKFYIQGNYPKSLIKAVPTRKSRNENIFGLNPRLRDMGKTR